jgi:AraC-like DNA-binding protein
MLLIDLPIDSMREEVSQRPDGPFKIDGALPGGLALGAELCRTLQRFIKRPFICHAPTTAERVLALSRALSMLPHESNRTRASASVRRLHAEGFIAERLGDPDLDAAAVARHVCLSTRHLNRLFAADDCTVTQWIWHRRLERAHRLLADLTWNGQTVADIAHHCGFSTPAHFASAFKARYRLTPSQHRRGDTC